MDFFMVLYCCCLSGNISNQSSNSQRAKDGYGRSVYRLVDWRSLSIFGIDRANCYLYGAFNGEIIIMYYPIKKKNQGVIHGNPLAFGGIA